MPNGRVEEAKEVKDNKEAAQMCTETGDGVKGSMGMRQADFRMTPSMTLATSSHLSTAVSMTSKISFHLMIWTGSFSSSKSWAMSVRHRRLLPVLCALI